MPYRFLEDIATADMAFEAWGATRDELFAACAAALLASMTHDPERIERRRHITIRQEHEELDLLLYSFLAELVFLKDARRLLLHADSVLIGEMAGGFRIEALMQGEEINPQRHRLLVDVKAVTLHRFRVICENGIWRATVVLDI